MHITSKRLKVRADGSVPVALSCPANARGGCSGVLRLTSQRGNRVFAASEEWTLRRGKSKVVVLEGVEHLLAALRALRAARVETKEQGPSPKGPRTSIAYLPIGPA